MFRIYGARLPKGAPCLTFPAGERSKGLETAARLYSELARIGADRSTVIVAFGGGVVGDLAGFVAATYHRGLRLLQIPTTLLAQVDSSIGGKVGVDIPEGKNLVGAFWPPIEVRICLDVLQTLDTRQFKNGLAEVYKCAIALDASFFERIRDMDIMVHSSVLPEIVERCVELKRQVVEADEQETLGLRAILNYGHTVAHAIETVTGYGPILHGEAVAAGMIVEARIGERLGVTSAGTTEAVQRALRYLRVPSRKAWCTDKQALLDAMRRDKKSKGGTLAFSLLDGIGSCKLHEDVPEAVVLQVLDEV